jgi:hypothetical protein
MTYSYENGEFIEVQGSVLVDSSLQIDGHTIFFDSAEANETEIRTAWGSNPVIVKRVVTAKKLTLQPKQTNL